MNHTILNELNRPTIKLTPLRNRFKHTNAHITRFGIAQTTAIVLLKTSSLILQSYLKKFDKYFLMSLLEMMLQENFFLHRCCEL